MKSLLVFALLPSLFTLGGNRLLGSWELEEPLQVSGKSHSVFEVTLQEQYDEAGAMRSSGVLKRGGWFGSSYTMTGYCYNNVLRGLLCDFRLDSGISMLIHADGQATMEVERDSGSLKTEMRLTSPYTELHL